MDNIVLWYPIGYTGTDPATNMVRAITPETGWHGFVNKRLKPGIQWFGNHKARIQLHNPFGVTSGKPMPADAWIEALTIDWLTADFVDAIGPLVNAGAEIIAYLGCPASDPEFIQEKRPHRIDNWLHRFWRSYRVVLEAGCSIAFDAASWFPHSSPTYYGVKLIEQLMTDSSLNSQVYVEATARLDKPEWFDAKQQILEKSYRTRHVTQDIGLWNKFPQWNPNTKQFEQLAPDGTVIQSTTYTNEILRITKIPYETITDVKSVLADGHTAIVPGRMIHDINTGNEILSYDELTG